MVDGAESTTNQPAHARFNSSSSQADLMSRRISEMALVEQTLRTNAIETPIHSHVCIFMMIEQVHDGREDGFNKRGRIHFERLGQKSAGKGREKSPHIVSASNDHHGGILLEVCKAAGGMQRAYFGATRWARAGSIVDMVATMPLRQGALACGSTRAA